MIGSAAKAARFVVVFWVRTTIDIAILNAVHRAFRAARERAA